MRIILAGAGTGGHFYPLIAIAERIRDIVRERHLIAPRIYYMAPEKYDEQALYDNEIIFIGNSAGKLRRYASVLTILDIIAMIFGCCTAILSMFRLMPDVIISKGGYGSVPVVLAGALFGIPIIIHESDSKPGRANLFLSRFATRIGIAFESAKQYFPESLHSKMALVGIPLRKDLEHTDPEGARQYLGLEVETPTLLVLGGSSGAQKINETLLATLTELVKDIQIIHQTGEKLFKETEGSAKVILEGSSFASRYHPIAFLNSLSMKRSAGVADLIVSRSGATAIAEIALWGKPSILIPIPETVSHDQRTNAYAYAHSGAATVLEENNLSPHILSSEILRIIKNKELASSMAAKSASMKNTTAATTIATEALEIALSHEN